MLPEQVEYLLVGSAFYQELLAFEGCMLHASAVVYEGQAYLFSADSGTGKSTHTQLWQETFGRENTYIFNDDKPAIRWENGQFYVYGTPFSGKYDISRNERVPLAGIAFLRRALRNSITRISSREVIPLFYKQTVRGIPAEKAEQLLTIMDRLFCQGAVYRLDCDISKDAVRTAYGAMKPEADRNKEKL